MSSSSADVAVFGAYSQIGYFLMPALAAGGHRVLALSRAPHEGFGRKTPGVTWRQYSNEHLTAALAGEDSLRNVIYLGPLKVLPELLPTLADRGVRRIIALGSTGRFYKTDSGDQREREMIAALIAAEQRMAARSEELGIHWTIFRPTLVYGCGMDKNITLIVRFIRRFGFFPLIGSGKGLRQPVHAADLASACVSALANPATYSKAYNLSGGGKLTYREMVEAVFQALDRNPRFFTFPLPALRAALSITRLLPRLRYLNPEMANRMNLDACFDHSEATQDFGFNPRPFAPDALAVRGPSGG